MQLNGFETWTKMNDSATAAAKELEALNLNLFDQLSRKNVELVDNAFAFNQKLFATLGQSPDLQSVINEQIKIASEYSGTVVSTMKEAADIVTDSQSDYQSWFEKGFRNVTTATQSLAPKTSSSRRKKAA